MSEFIRLYLEGLIPHFFYLAIFLIVYIETAVIIAFFIPGDTLLFTAGLIVASSPNLNIWSTCLIIAVAAFLGDQTAYQFGRRSGRGYFERRPGLRLLLSRSESFYRRYGSSAIFLSRFYPWFRTLIPFLAGASKMNYLRFLITNSISAFCWAFGITWLGFGANSIPWLKSSSRLIAVFFVTITIGLAFRNYMNNKNSHEDCEARGSHLIS